MRQEEQTIVGATPPAETLRTLPPPAGRAPQRLLVLLFLAMIVSVPLLQWVVDLRKGQTNRWLAVFRQKPTAAHLRAYERSLEETSVVAKALRPWFQFLQFTWLRDGGEKALVGREGWLFYKPGFDAMVSRSAGRAATNDPVSAIVAWRDALSARRIQLLVVPAPNKESIYPDFLTRRATAERIVMSPATRDLMARLQAANVECVDLFAVFAAARTNSARGDRVPLYLAQDSHWSPAGMMLAAQAVAGRLKEKGWVTSGRTEYHEKSVPVERVGDVLRMLQSASIKQTSIPERVSCVQVLRNEAGELYQDQADAEVLVLGDSFLRIYQQDEPGAAGFIAHLARELKQPLTSIVNDGGASTLVRQEVYRRPGLLQHKRVVVWEFVERDIRLGTEGWQHVPLPAYQVQ